MCLLFPCTISDKSQKIMFVNWMFDCVTDRLCCWECIWVAFVCPFSHKFPSVSFFLQKWILLYWPDKWLLYTEYLHSIILLLNCCKYFVGFMYAKGRSKWRTCNSATKLGNSPVLWTLFICNLKSIVDNSGGFHFNRYSKRPAVYGWIFSIHLIYSFLLIRLTLLVGWKIKPSTSWQLNRMAISVRNNNTYSIWKINLRNPRCNNLYVDWISQKSFLRMPIGSASLFNRPTLNASILGRISSLSIISNRLSKLKLLVSWPCQSEFII